MKGHFWLISGILFTQHQSVDRTQTKDAKKVPWSWWNLISKNSYKLNEMLPTQAVSKEIRSTPRWSIGLNRSVSGKGSRVVTKELNCQLIHPPTTIMGTFEFNQNRSIITSKPTMLSMLPFIISVIAEGSAIGLLPFDGFFIAYTRKFRFWIYSRLLLLQTYKLIYLRKIAIFFVC